MLLITKKIPTPNTQKDSIPAKHLFKLCSLFCLSPPHYSYVFAHSFLYITLLSLQQFIFFNRDMSSPSKRHVSISIIFILKHQISQTLIKSTELSRKSDNKKHFFSRISTLHCKAFFFHDG